MIQPIASHKLYVTRTKYMNVIALSGYRDPVRALILAKSWGNIMASRDLGNLIWQLTPFAQVPADYIIPVPLHWTRYARRGFNQAQEIGLILAQNRKIEMIDLLTRIKRTKFQKTLSAKERHVNVNRAFKLSVDKIDKFAHKHLVLVDDLMTTGSTLIEAGRTLLNLKPASITVVVAARVV